jgi:hypothetical protein
VPGIAVQVQHVGVPARHPQHPVGPAADQQPRRRGRDRRQRQVPGHHVRTVRGHQAAVVEGTGEPQHLFQPVHPGPEPGQRHPDRVELLRAPSGAEAGGDPLAAGQHGQLGEVPQQQGRVQPRGIHHHRLQFQSIG